MISTIFGRLWAVWGLTWFIITMLLFLPFFLVCRYLLREPLCTRLFVSASRIWMGIYLPLIGCPLRIYGRERFLPGQTYIVVCNHNSLMDVPVTSPGIPGVNKTIAKKEFAAVPVFGIIYQLGSVIVDRKSEQSRRESYTKMKEVLRMGAHVCIYPEGTRNKTSEPLKPFYDGAFRLSLETGVPVMPAVLFNTKRAMPPGKGFYLRPQPLEMHFLPPMSPAANEGTQEFKQRVWEYMRTFIVSRT